MTDDINVSRDLLRAELSQLELRLVRSLSDELEKKATVQAVETLTARHDADKEKLSTRVTLLEKSRAEQSGAAVIAWKVWSAVAPLATGVAVYFITH